MRPTCRNDAGTVLSRSRRGVPETQLLRSRREKLLNFYKQYGERADDH